MNSERLYIYIYLGKILTNKTELQPEFEKRIMNENRAYYVLLHVLKSQSLLRAEKIKIYKTNGNICCRILDNERRYC